MERYAECLKNMMIFGDLPVGIVKRMEYQMYIAALEGESGVPLYYPIEYRGNECIEDFFDDLLDKGYTIVPEVSDVPDKVRVDVYWDI